MRLHRPATEHVCRLRRPSLAIPLDRPIHWPERVFLALRPTSMPLAIMKNTATRCTVSSASMAASYVDVDSESQNIHFRHHAVDGSVVNEEHFAAQ